MQTHADVWSQGQSDGFQGQFLANAYKVKCIHSAVKSYPNQKCCLS